MTSLPVLVLPSVSPSSVCVVSCVRSLALGIVLQVGEAEVGYDPYGDAAMWQGSPT